MALLCDDIIPRHMGDLILLRIFCNSHLIEQTVIIEQQLFIPVLSRIHLSDMRKDPSPSVPNRTIMIFGSLPFLPESVCITLSVVFMYSRINALTLIPRFSATACRSNRWKQSTPVFCVPYPGFLCTEPMAKSHSTPMKSWFSVLSQYFQVVSL